MEESIGPVEQMEAILKEESLRLAAEQTKMHAEMILFSACLAKPVVQGMLLFKASSQGADYMTGVMVSVGLVARNWGRVMADDPDIEFAKYLNTEAEAECAEAPDDSFAHRLVRAVMEMKTTEDADVIRTDIRLFADKHGAHIWGRAMVHYVGLCAELVMSVAEIRNGELPDGLTAEDVTGSNDDDR